MTPQAILGKFLDHLPKLGFTNFVTVFIGFDFD